MVGGKEETVEAMRPVLSAMASSVVYVGPIGSGNVAKLANQMIVGINIAACSGSIYICQKKNGGTDPELVYQAIRGGLAGSNVMDAKVPMMIDGNNYTPGFRINLHTKGPHERPERRSRDQPSRSVHSFSHGNLPVSERYGMRRG